jgi:hypothetical protein
MKMYYRDFIFEGELKDLAEFFLLCFVAENNTKLPQPSNIYVLDPQKQADPTVSNKGQISGIPTQYLDTKKPVLASKQEKLAFLESIKPINTIDLSSKQGLRTRIIYQLMNQTRISVKELMQKSGTDNSQNIRRTIKFLRKAGCQVRVEHYYTQAGKTYFDTNVGSTSLITLMSLGTPEQGKKARQQERAVWRKYSAKKPATPKTAGRVVEAQKLLDTPQ